MKENKPDGFIEQFMVSSSVIRQADKLPLEMVEQHLNMLTAYGIIGESLNQLLNIDKEEWLRLLDKIQQNERGYK